MSSTTSTSTGRRILSPVYVLLSVMAFWLSPTVVSVCAFSEIITTSTVQQQQPISRRQRRRHVASLAMVPRYNPTTGRWEPNNPNEDSSAGYPPIGSLIRQGPIPFFQRLKDPDMYDQAVLKLMATSSDSLMSRDEAQGNMDAYLQNPNDWALQKMEEKNGAPVFEYANANMESENLLLTAAWAGLLATLVGRIVYVTAFGCDDFCRQYHW